MRMTPRVRYKALVDFLHKAVIVSCVALSVGGTAVLGGRVWYHHRYTKPLQDQLLRAELELEVRESLAKERGEMPEMKAGGEEVMLDNASTLGV